MWELARGGPRLPRPGESLRALQGRLPAGEAGTGRWLRLICWRGGLCVQRASPGWRDHRPAVLAPEGATRCIALVLDPNSSQPGPFGCLGGRTGTGKRPTSAGVGAPRRRRGWISRAWPSPWQQLRRPRGLPAPASSTEHFRNRLAARLVCLVDAAQIWLEPRVFRWGRCRIPAASGGRCRQAPAAGAAPPLASACGGSFGGVRQPERRRPGPRPTTRIAGRLDRSDPVGPGARLRRRTGAAAPPDCWTITDRCYDHEAANNRLGWRVAGSAFDALAKPLRRLELLLQKGQIRRCFRISLCCHLDAPDSVFFSCVDEPVVPDTA